MISNNYGESWSQPIILNSLDTPQLEGMIPTYWYLADKMEHLYDDWYRVHLQFYSQSDYGSSVLGNGPQTGGMIYYTSIDINFGFLSVENDVQMYSVDSVLQQNYPNPFNPETRISFSLPEDGEVSLGIYNLRGQLVKKIAQGFYRRGEHHVVWNGTDWSNQMVASGVYFAKITTGSVSETRKMLLLK